MVCAVTSVKELGALLAEEANAACPGQHQVGFEVVIEVDRQDGLGLKRLVRGSSRKWKGRAGGQPYGMAIGHGDYRSALPSERDGSDP